MQAKCLEKLGRISQAKALLQSVIQKAPQWAEGYNALAKLCLIQGKFRTTYPLFRKAISLAPGNPYICANFIVCGIALGRYKEAEKAGMAALSISPGYFGLYPSLIRLYRRCNPSAWALTILWGQDISQNRVLALQIALFHAKRGNWSLAWQNWSKVFYPLENLHPKRQSNTFWVNLKSYCLQSLNSGEGKSKRPWQN